LILVAFQLFDPLCRPCSYGGNRTNDLLADFITFVGRSAFGELEGGLRKSVK